MIDNIESILEKLNDQQREAVTTTEGYVRVVAGAGSGKTRALSYRYVFLVEMMGVSTENILCVTFTNKAAGEMKNRIRSLIGDHDTGYVCTFHGFCVKQLREDIHLLGYPRNFIIIDEEDQNAILKNIYEEKGINARRYTFSMARDMICMKKCSLDYMSYMVPSSSEALLNRYENATSQEDIIFYGYLKEQKKNYSLDYDDLINFTYYILTKYKEERDKWQHRMQYIMVDEFQDVSNIQYKLADILSGYHNNLFIVGDPDQTIYSWRGADVNLFLRFSDVHPDTQTIFMDLNYRSRTPIIKGSNSLIEKNRHRIEKNLQPVKSGDEKILYYHGKDTKDEAKWIVSNIKQLNDKDVSFENIGVLYRAHHVSRSVEEELLRNKIPYVIYSGVAFYGRKEIKDIICYLRMLIYEDDFSFIRTVNEPRRNMGKKRMELLSMYAKEINCSLYRALKDNLDNPLIAKSDAASYVQLIEKYKANYSKYRISELLENILAETGYEAMLKDAGEDERLENLAELKQAVYDYEVNSEEDTCLEDYLQNISLFTNMDKETRKKSVKLMTIHASKGLEFPYVFVCGLSEGVFPSSRITGYDDIEEERRLAYVAYTRAEERLFLSDAGGITFDGENRCPSRFIFNIDEAYLQYVHPFDDEVKAAFLKRIEDSEKVYTEQENPTITEGTRISHKYLGEGTVLKVDYEHKCYEIQFDKIKTSRSIMMTMELQII